MAAARPVTRLLRLPGESVYSKALIIFVGFSIVLGTAVVLLTRSLILGEFAGTERQEMIGTLQRFATVLDRETRPVQIALSEAVARLSDSGKLPAPAELATLQLDAFATVSASGKDIHSAFLERTGALQQLDASAWAESLSAFSASGDPQPRAGFFTVGPMLVAAAAQPLPDGSMAVAARIIGDEPLTFLEGVFGARIGFTPFQPAAHGGSTALHAALAIRDLSVETTGPDLLTGHVLLRAPDGRPLGEFQLTQPRPLYREGLHAVQVFLTLLTLAGGALFVIVWFILDRTILARIRDLTRKVEGERDSGRLPVRLNFVGTDELGHLARRIEDLARLLETSLINYRAVVEDQTEVICRFSPGFEITLSNDVFRKLFPHDTGRPAFLRQCLPADAHEALAACFARLTRENPVETFVHQVAHPDSAGVWFRSTLRALYDPAGKLTGGQWVAADISSQVRSQQQLQESEQKLRMLSNRLLRLRDDERRKIARELHDSTAQNLSALEMNMSLLEPAFGTGDERVRRIIAETRQIARDCCLELRNISYLLHPPLLDEVGLRFAVQWFVDGLEKRSSIKVSLAVDDAFPRLSPDVETALFRVVQEAMGNIYRHSKAERAWIRIAVEGTEAILEIRDNGIGFSDPDRAAEGVGFAGMRERIAQVGGRLEIENSPYGVTVSARVPIQPTHADENPHRG